MGIRFWQQPQPLARWLLRGVRYLNLMRALEWRYLAPWIRDVAGWHVLDVGCGHGLYSLELARRGATLVGCDLERPALTKALRSSHSLGLDGQAFFLLADGAALPLVDGQFDLVVCNCVLEHIGDDRAALGAMARSLRPGGTLYLSVDNAEHGLALDAVDRLPAGIRSLLLRPEVLVGPSLLAGIDAHLDRVYAVQRRYRRADLVTALSNLGLTLLDCRPYLMGVGAAQFEAFHALRGLDSTKGVGRLAYMLSSLLLYPLAAWSDDRRGTGGHGLAIVARKMTGAKEDGGAGILADAVPGNSHEPEG